MEKNYLYSEALNAAACDGDGCDTWSREPQQHGFMLLVWGESKITFCSADCLLKFVADHSIPMVVIPND